MTLFVLLLSLCLITTGMPSDAWGDDFAAYLSEGFAIADGRLEDQARINYFYHPTQVPEEVENGRLVYVWGYPLIQALVYKMIGFDFDSIIWYKIPLVLSLALTGGVLVLFFRRRFSLFAAVALSVLFCNSGNLLDVLNTLYSDLPFLFFSMLTLLLIEVFIDSAAKSKKTVWLGIILGISMWITYEIRLSGIAVCLVSVLGFVVAVLKKQIKGKDRWAILIPSAVLLLLILVSEHFLLAPATTNLTGITSREHGNNVKYYVTLLSIYFQTLLGMNVSSLGYLFFVAAVIGLLTKGWKENLHLTVLLLGTIYVVIILPYVQSLRYFYNVLPFILMYLAYGFQFLGKHAKRLYASATGSGQEETGKLSRLITLTALSGALVLCCISPIGRASYNLRHWGEKGAMDVYSPEAIEMYRYIQNEIPDDKIVAFPKPRALYLNTGHLSFRPGVNGHELEDADYYLDTTFRFGDFLPLDLSEVEKTVEFQNAGYTLYRLQ